MLFCIRNYKYSYDCMNHTFPGDVDLGAAGMARGAVRGGSETTNFVDGLTDVGAGEYSRPGFGASSVRTLESSEEREFEGSWETG
jgi:hypothetical protein